MLAAKPAYARLRRPVSDNAALQTELGEGRPIQAAPTIARTLEVPADGVEYLVEPRRRVPDGGFEFFFQGGQDS